jgi:hypothetical protein
MLALWSRYAVDELALVADFMTRSRETAERLVTALQARARYPPRPRAPR